MSYQPPYYGAPPPAGHSPQPPYGQQAPYGAPQQQQQYPPPPQQGGAYPPPQQSAYPPQQAYGAPAPQYGQPQPQYGSPAPQQGAPYGQPPPQGYNQPPPGQYPPQGQGYPPQQQYPPQGYPPQQQPGQYGAPPPQQYGAPAPAYGQPPPGQAPYGQPAPYSQPNYAQPPPGNFPATPPTLGYGPAQHIQWDGSADAEGIRKAMKGFGTDEKALIKHLATKDPLQVKVIQTTYKSKFSRPLLDDIKAETGGSLEDGLMAIVRGPLEQDVYLLRDAMAGPGTKEAVLNDVLLGRSNADMRAIKDLYQKTHRRSLEADIKADLSMKTERHFLMVLAANRAEDAAPVVQQQVDADVMELYKATEGKAGTDELLVCTILTQRNDGQIRGIAHAYQQKFTKSLESVIIKEFSGHMEEALLHQLRTGTDKAMRDALLLEASMAGMGTKDHLLVNRVVRVHWDKNHMQQVKGAYQSRFKTSLVNRVKGETSGDYERLMVACLGE